MFMKKIALAGALALFATGASATTQLTVADASENGGGVIDLFSADGFQFQNAFTGAAGTLSFTFENTEATAARIVLSSATINQLNSLNAAFSGGASVDWATAGNVASAVQGQTASGQLSFTLGAGETDTLVLTFGDAINKNGSPEIDFIVATVVPLPAGVLLMGTALAGFGVAARRKNRKA